MEKEQKAVILLKRLMAMPPNIQLYHWQTRSNARHVASGNLYNQLISLIDQFMEVFMGKYHRVKLLNKDKLPLCSMDAKGAVEFLKENINFLANLEKFMPELVKSTDLLNIRDSIVGELNKTLYLFTLR